MLRRVAPMWGNCFFGLSGRSFPSGKERRGGRGSVRLQSRMEHGGIRRVWPSHTRTPSGGALYSMVTKETIGVGRDFSACPSRALRRAFPEHGVQDQGREGRAGLALCDSARRAAFA